MVSVRTDLAVEAKELYEEKSSGKIPGVEVEEYREGFIKVTNVKIVSEEGERVMNKPKGSYITIDIPEISGYDKDTMEEVSEVLAKVLSPLVKLEDSMTALVVGLGNWNVTPDALGPKVVEGLMITRHLKELIPNEIDEGIRPVCAIAPGVLGLTGIETGEIIKAVSNKIKPNLIICIDALASRKLDRINRTIQIGNTGISPGSGVGNKRMEISERTLGIPVIAIGVPTVVDAATVANDTIDMVIDAMINQATEGSKFYNMLKDLNRDEKQRMIEEVLNPYVGNLMVTPKEVDSVIDSISKVISTGINIALQPALDLNQINNYIS
ncbi:spore protease [Clostridium tetanomorphum]|uniref:Germination protease n=1 Tax=Clostridium tetanomorphum TaxID=1553 RepID=A0A923J138_CLOTT|nr:GPR endopeptidase [Clostridium tetanomorphum]KAJ49211.1 germination protease [Clostridium tetanomorphum DSM 665]KAJ53846.1 germination protease [Clostridium tetanomorphum DSM 665]MBC2397360.1 GPR endopeptidase [Clostridium tetanomorphum]MBP1862580.1 spore protease [Clostridium tetanomorphum]NRS85579.1 spore protease [Clostridium tetanomorphum]